MHPSNRLAHHNLAADARLAARAIENGEVDPLTFSRDLGGGRHLSMSAWFLALRSQGITPHLGEREEDAEAARHQLEALGEIRPRRKRGLQKGAGTIKQRQGDPGLQPPGGSGGSASQGGAKVAPDVRMGVAEGTFPSKWTDGPELWSAAAYKHFGSYADMVADLATMGCGHIRRLKKCDFYWGSLFPLGGDYSSETSFQNGAIVPDPPTIAASLQARSWRVFVPFVNMALACAKHGMRISVTPFHSAGGSPLVESLTSTERIVSTGPEDDVENPTWAALAAAAPAHQNSIILPSTSGWDEWYWNFSGNTGTDDERLYQRFAVNVWPSEDGEADSTYVSAYMRECARRKALGIAAFADTLGAFLARLHVAFRALGYNLSDILDVVELGNEWDTAFKRSVSDGGTADPTVIGYGEMEAGRYFALLGGPIRAHVSGLQFKVCELNSDDDEALSSGCEWLYGVVTSGMTSEVALWKERQLALLLSARGLPVSAEYRPWASMCREIGYQWPATPAGAGDLLGFGVTDLCQQVGFHWFHGVDRRQGPERAKTLDTCSDEVGLIVQIDLFREKLVTPLGADGFLVVESVGAMTFPALFPKDPAEEAVWFEGTTPVYQAANLVRLLSVLRAKGVEYASWFTTMLEYIDPNKTDWDKFDTAGLRNDTIIDGSRDRTQVAYARPAWYAWQRLNWLFGRSEQPSVLYAAEGFVVIKFTALTGYAPLEVGVGGSLSQSWKFAYLCWIDENATDPNIHQTDGRRRVPDRDGLLTLLGLDLPVFTFPLIPRVQVTEASEGVLATAQDANGYASTPDVDWAWRGWNAGATVTQNALMVEIRVHRANPAAGRAGPLGISAPICIMTNLGTAFA